MPHELLIYADESAKHGKYFSNFYGGALVRSIHLRHVITVLEAAKSANNMHGEIKWQKVTEHYLAKYIAVIDSFFDFIEADVIKMRIMFTQNANVPTML